MIRSNKKLQLMKQRQHRKTCLIYPEDRIGQVWDMIVSLTLLTMCVITPIYISFHDEGGSEDPDGTRKWEPLQIVNLILDIIFAIDIIMVFCSTFYDEDFKLIDDRKIIANNYLKGMFILDVFAVLPFDFIYQNETNFNGLIRITKIGRLQKLIKLTRLLKILKIMKSKSSILKFTKQIFQLGNGFERIIFFIFSSILVCHICACLWVFSTSILGNEVASWLDDDSFQDMNDSDRYLTSFYFIITTFSTVGYGDISATNNIERIFCLIFMSLSVTDFVAGTGEFINLLST